MKQKTMDHELMARFNKEAQEAEKQKFEKAKVAVARLENKRKVRIISWREQSIGGGEKLLYDV